MSLSSLPAIIAVTGADDYGPSDGVASANCPHCGAPGRYVLHFRCADGSRRSAMRGCIKLFPGTNESRLTEQARQHALEARAKGRQLASWWDSILKAVDDLEAGGSVEAFRATVLRAGAQRDGWLRANRRRFR